MGFYILLFLLYFGIPVMVGFFLGMVLRELYQLQLAEEKKEEKQVQVEEETTPQNLYDASLDEEELSANVEDEAKEVEATSTEPIESSATMTDSPMEAAASVVATEKSIQSEQSEQSPILDLPEDSEEELVLGLKSVFNHQHEVPHDIPLDMLKIGDVLDNIVKNEETPELPHDISLQLENEQAPEELLKQYNAAGESAESAAAAVAAAEEENLARSMISEEKPEMDFSNDQNADSLHPDISPQAVELLGENFDFDALLNKEPKTEADILLNTDTDVGTDAGTDIDTNINNIPSNIPNNIPEQAAGLSMEDYVAQNIPAHEIGLGIYQANGGIITTSSALLEQSSGNQDIVSSFPANFIQDTIIEPDESAQKYNFTAESQPMLVRNKTKNRS